MQEFEITVKLTDGQTEALAVPEGTTLQELAKKYQEYFPDTIVLALCGNR